MNKVDKKYTEKAKEKIDSIIKELDVDGYEDVASMKNIHVDATFLSKDYHSKYARDLVRHLAKTNNVTIRVITLQQGDPSTLDVDMKPYLVDSIPFSTDLTITVGDPRIRDVYKFNKTIGKTMHIISFGGLNYPQIWDILLKGVDFIVTDNSNLRFKYHESVYNKKKGAFNLLKGCNTDVFKPRKIKSNLSDKYKFIAYIHNEYSQLNAILENVVSTVRALAGTKSLVIFHPTGIVEEKDYRIIKRNIQKEIYNLADEEGKLPSILLLGKKYSDCSDAELDDHVSKFMNISDLVVSVTRRGFHNVDDIVMKAMAMNKPFITHFDDSSELFNLSSNKTVHAKDILNYDSALGIKWYDYNWDKLIIGIKDLFNVIIKERDQLKDAFKYIERGLENPSFDEEIDKLISEVFE
jgi:hypothetical protein